MSSPITVIYQVDPAEMSRRGRLGALALHSRHDPKVTTAPARTAFLAKFEREIDPDSVLPEDERARRARDARSEYFRGLSLLGAESRRKVVAR